MTRKISINKANGDLAKAARYFDYKDRMEARRKRQKARKVGFTPVPKKAKLIRPV